MVIDKPQCSLDTCRYYFDGNCTNEKRYKNCEFAHFKELEVDDRLIELPCKVGDTVYFPTQDRHDEATINSISIGEDGILVHWVQYERGVDIVELWDEDFFEISEIGKTVFLTKEEAERKLAELKGTEE